MNPELPIPTFPLPHRLLPLPSPKQPPGLFPESTERPLTRFELNPARLRRSLARLQQELGNTLHPMVTPPSFDFDAAAMFVLRGLRQWQALMQHVSMPPKLQRRLLFQLRMRAEALLRANAACLCSIPGLYSNDREGALSASVSIAEALVLQRAQIAALLNSAYQDLGLRLTTERRQTNDSRSLEPLTWPALSDVTESQA